MCFIKDNTNFIQQKIIVAMNGLAEEECLKNYDLIKEDTRRRLKQSYLSCDDKSIFYKDAFSTLSFYETDYLMANLLFEKERILLELINESNFQEKLKFENLNSFAYSFFKTYLTESSDLDTVVKLFQEEFEISTAEINGINLLQSLRNKFIILLKENKGEDELRLFYCVYVNYIEIKDLDLNEKTKLMEMLYGRINNENNLEIFNNIDNINKLLDDSFIFQRIQKTHNHEDLMFLPFLTKLNTDNKIYLKQKDVFEKCLIKNKKINNSKNSFSPIFELLESETNPEFIKTYFKIIIEKINNFELPNENEIDNLNKIKGDNEVMEIIKEIKKRLYLY